MVFTVLGVVADYFRVFVKAQESSLPAERLIVSRKAQRGSLPTLEADMNGKS